MVNHKQRILSILETVCDPEIPVLSVMDLGIVREIKELNEAEKPPTGGWQIIITPTYSGCPAMDMIAVNIRLALAEAGYQNIDIKNVLSPAWTTDWISEAGKEKLQAYGIAPPVSKSFDQQLLEETIVPCPHCGSRNTKLVSEFSSTACKAFYTCTDCLEPFDHFKCH